MPKIKFNEANRPYYSEDFIKGFECGTERQYKADQKTGHWEEYGHNKGGCELTDVRWIPVSERLPEAIGFYMTTIDYGKNGIGVGQRYYHGKGLGWGDYCVIAWMSLPEPYKVESEEIDADSN